MTTTATPPIWVISLRRSVDRRARIVSQLETLNLPYEIIDGVDGRELDPAETAAHYSTTEAITYNGRELTPGEIGCSLSHLRLYQRQIAEGLEEVVILEDDAFLEPEFANILTRTKSFPEDWDLVTLYGSPARVSFWGAKVFDEHHRFVRFASIAYGALGYVLRLEGARKLAATALPIRMPADHLTGGGLRNTLRIYGLTPACVRERLPGARYSTMPESHEVRSRWPTRDELHPVIWRLHKFKWGLVHFYEKCNPYRMI